MKKLLLLLLCVPLIFSCGEKEKDTTQANDKKIQTTFLLLLIEDKKNQIDEVVEIDENLKNQKAILKSYKLAEKTILALGIDTNTVSLEELTKNYVQKLKITPYSKESAVLELSIEDNSKESIDYLNKLAELYILQGLDHKNMTATNTLSFISNQIQETKDTLHLIENKLKEFKEKNPNLDVYDKDYGTFFQKQKTEGNVSEYQVHLSYYKELLSYLQNSYATGGIVSPTSVGISNSELNSLISQFITLNSEKNDLEVSQKVTKAHPKYQAVLSKISFTKQSIIENLKNLIASTNSAKRELEKRINDFEKEIDQLPESEKEYVQLKREFMQAERIVDYLETKKQDVSIAKEGVQSDCKILEPARVRK